MGKERKRKFEEVKPDMTPMIDVVFLLLIFFIVTLKFKTLEGVLDAALPKDRGTSSATVEEIEKVDIVIKVANPGSLDDDPATGNRLKHYVNRVLNIDLGANTFRVRSAVDQNGDRLWDDLKAVQNFLKPFDKEETPVTLDSRKGVVYGDVVAMLDIVIRENFEKVSFAGSFEDE